MATGGIHVQPRPTEAHIARRVSKRIRKQTETDNIKANAIPSINYDLLAKEIVNQQKDCCEKNNIGEQPILVNSVKDLTLVLGKSTSAACILL